MEPLLSIHEVATILQVPVGTIYNWRVRGEGPRGVKVGKHVRWRRQDVEAWVADRFASA